MLEDLVANSGMPETPVHVNIRLPAIRLLYVYCLYYSRVYFAWITATDLSAFGSVCTAILQDVQERFIYRAHIYIRNEILNYRPSVGDLAYPDKLLMMQVLITSFVRLLLLLKASSLLRVRATMNPPNQWSSIKQCCSVHVVIRMNQQHMGCIDRKFRHSRYSQKIPSFQ